MTSVITNINMLYMSKNTKTHTHNNHIHYLTLIFFILFKNISQTTSCLIQLLSDRKKERNLFSFNMSEKWNHYFLFFRVLAECAVISLANIVGHLANLKIKTYKKNWNPGSWPEAHHTVTEEVKYLITVQQFHL